MTAIKIILLGLLFNYGLCFSQNIDSLQSVYSKYYETSFLTSSPSGKYIVLNHYNTFGKDDDELYNIKTKKGITLDKNVKYYFIGDEYLLMQNTRRSRFQNLKTMTYRDVEGTYSAKIIYQTGEVLLNNSISKELILVSKDGKILWKEFDVATYELDGKTNQLFFISKDQLVIKDLKDQQSTSYQIKSNVHWMSYVGNMLYCASILESSIELFALNLKSHQLAREVIKSPEDFQFALGLNTYFEIRENNHFLLPLYLKSNLKSEKNPELKISYSNNNDKDTTAQNYYLGIYNLNEEKWDYKPNQKQKIPVYKFLNDRGDFIVYDHSKNIIEEQQNAILDLNLILDYGKISYLLPKKRIDDGNYLWDRDTEQFIYFDSKRWMCHHIIGGEDHELLPLDMGGWENQVNNGLTYAPARSPLRIKGTSLVLLSNQFDYFILNLTNHKLQRITNGEGQNTKYELQARKDYYPKSSWNIKLAEIDLKEEIIFKLFNQLNYDSGFATYLYESNKMDKYKQGHYKQMIPYIGGVFFTSDFSLEPFKLTRYEGGKYRIVYESLKEKKESLGKIKYQIFRYNTVYGTSNAALLFPTDYSPQKNYPMIVNIYEDKSKDIVNFLPPFLTTTFGFNYIHYLMNGYIILLPDLQYAIGKVKNSVITSLEKSIDTAKSLASIDDRNVAVVGLSFGGYETGLALTNSKYFKTGVAGVMISDLVSHALSYSEFNSIPNYRRTENQQLRMKDNLFNNYSKYLDNSPIYNLNNLDSPALIWTGSKDKNVSPNQSRMFFLGMKRLQKKAVLLEYVNETHNISLASNQLDLNVKIWQWLEYYLKNKPPAKWIYPIGHQ